MFALFTDFSLEDPYVGQMHAVLAAGSPQQRVIDLFHQVPRFAIQSGAYLLPAYTQYLPEDSIIIAVVDPGVGSARLGVVIETDQHWFVGPDNGLFTLIARWHSGVEVFRIPEVPQASSSFHGRDVFCPQALRIAKGDRGGLEPTELSDHSEWPDDLPQVLYIDHYGNAITGIRGEGFAEGNTLQVNGKTISYARVFADVKAGEVFWYRNANGLVEIAVNQGSVAEVLDLNIGDSITF